MPLHQLLLLATVLPLTACQAAGRFLEEQVDVRDGTTRWGVIQPRGNVIVATAEVDGPCL